MMKYTRHLQILLSLFGVLLCCIPASGCRRHGGDETGGEVKGASPENLRCEVQYIPNLHQIEFSIFDGSRHVQTLYVPEASEDEDGGEGLLAESLKDFEESDLDRLLRPRIDVGELEDYIGGLDRKCAQEDVTGDGNAELLLHLGNFGVSENIYWKAYRWDEKQRSFVAIEGYDLIPNPKRRDDAVYGDIRRGGDNYLYTRYVFGDGRFVPDSEVEMVIPESELEETVDDTDGPNWHYIERIYTGDQAKFVRETTSVSDLSEHWRKKFTIIPN